LVLTTGRVRDQWHTMTRTGKVDSLLKNEPYAFLELHPEDAERIGVSDGDLVQVTTRRGGARAPARVTDSIRPGTCFMPFHWGSSFGDAAINNATTGAFDPVSKQPELKFSACRVEVVNDRVRPA
jgi:anaerobic selenocysteine-containing dehydrogenase